MFCACTEETSRVLSDRRLETLRALADRSYQAKTAEEACKIASEELAHNLNDLPFTLLYLFDANSRKAHLCGKSGINSVTAAKLSTINIDSAESPWPFQDVLTHVKAIVMTKFEEKLGSFSGGHWPESTQRALVLPLIKAPAKKVTGFLVAGISPCLKLDDSYRSFLDLVAIQAATAIANASTYQEEHQRAEELAKLNRAKTVFFSNLSHEFRTPLTLILDPLKEAIAEALHWLPNVSYDTNLKDSTLMANKFPMGLFSENRPRIVWADDNKDLRSYVTRLLSLRYEVETVSNGKAALAAIRRRPPSLILVDVMMPDLNGFDVLHAVRADKYLRSIPVILLSARAGEEVQIEGIASGADDYLIKPFRAHELLARVDVHLKMASLKAAAEKAVKESEKKLAIELQSAQQLQHISSRLIKESTIDAMCEEILDTAMAIMNSEFSSIQILDTKHDTLRLLAWKNFHPKSAEYWQEVSFKTGTICGAALLHNERIIVPNLYEAEFLKNSESLPYFLLSGITAVQSTPLTARDGRVLGMISTHWRERHEPNKHQLALFDVLARQLADVLERQHSLEALKESDRRKDEFLAVLAHELRNPLFPLKNAIYLLLSDSNSNLPLLQMMERQITHIIRLVDDLMEISRITTGKIELHKKFTNLGTIINNAIEICKPLLERNHQQVILSLPHLPLVVHADTVRMTQVFANLFNNSAKYSPDNSLIHVNVSCAENTISVSVRDNGMGISKEILPKIFEMFTQENRSIKPHNRGLGIGLAMVRKLLELQGGSVKASSSGLNQGSEFTENYPKFY